MTCPRCRKNNSLKPDHEFQERVDRIEVTCDHCAKVCTLSEMREHAELCKALQETIKCNYPGCFQSVARKDFSSHAEQHYDETKKEAIARMEKVVEARVATAHLDKNEAIKTAEDNAKAEVATAQKQAANDIAKANKEKEAPTGGGR